FLARFKRELLAIGDYPEAIRRTLHSVGRGMTFASLVLVVGFLMFLSSVMASVTNFGGLVALTVVVALLADLFLTPALLVVFKPLRVEKVQAKEDAPAKAIEEVESG